MPFSFIKAITILAAVTAFFLTGCQPKRVAERPPVEKLGPDWFALAEQARKAGDDSQALSAYERYLADHPVGEKSRMALYRMAGIHNKNRRYRKALTLLTKIAREYPGHPEQPRITLEIAGAYFHLGDYERSLSEATKWTKKYPGSILRGEAYFFMGMSHKALSERSTAFYWLLRSSGEFHESPGRPAEIKGMIQELIQGAGIDELTEMAEYASGSEYAPPILHRMASIYLDEGKLDEARASATALVHSTKEEKWLTVGRQLNEHIEEILSVRRGVVGCLLPLSGPFAIYGQEVLNGIQMGMGLFSESAGDTGLELIIRDTMGDPEVAVKEMEDLVSEDKVMAIIGPLASKTAQAAAVKAQELGVPIITLTQKDNITAEGDMVFRNFLTPRSEINRLMARAVNNMGWRKFGILYPDNSYGRFFMNLFWDEVEETGGSITAVESYPPDETDFADQIKRMVGLFYPRPESVKRMLEEMKYLQAENLPEEEAALVEETDSDSENEPEPIVDFDAVFIPDSYQQVALIAPQFPFYNVFDIRLMGTSLWQSRDLIETAGDYVQGALFPSGFFVAESNAEPLNDFIRLYEESFGSSPGILAATGYDTMGLIRTLMTSGNFKTRKDFRDALLNHEGFFGITGEISFDPQGEVKKEPLLLTVAGRHLRVVQ